MASAWISGGTVGAAWMICGAEDVDGRADILDTLSNYVMGDVEGDIDRALLYSHTNDMISPSRERVRMRGIKHVILLSSAG